MVYRISNFIVLIVLILKFFIVYINAIPPPPHPLPLPPTPTTLTMFSSTMSINSCNCIRAKDCVSYIALMRQLKGVIERMRNAACGLVSDSEQMVCCPNADASTASKPERSQNTQEFNMRNDFSTETKERWIWERRPITNDSEKPKNDMFNVQKKFLDVLPEYDYTNTNLLDDYYDWKTHRNCPPILYHEKHDFHRHFFYQPQRPHYHDYHHGFYHQHGPPRDHHSQFNDNHHVGHHHPHSEYDDNLAENPDESALIYPDKRHRIWPPHRPDSEASATNNRGHQTTPPIAILPTTEILPTTPFSTQKPTINSSNCGVTLNKRLIGGIEALPGEFPWITRIAYLNRSDNSVAYRCSGSFVTDIHIVTAAHCVTNLDGTISLSHIRINDLSQNSQQEDQNFYEIAETFVHPNFDRPKRANDIAIIKIKKPPGVPINYGTICLPKLTSFGNSGVGVVAGWSNDTATTTSDQRVRYLKLPILNHTECANRYEKFRQGFSEKITIDRGMLCTQGLSNGSDVCRGDSGGPLMDDGSSSATFNDEGRYTLIGIVAFGPLCGFTNLLPGVYMRVSEFVGWITNTVG